MHTHIVTCLPTQTSHRCFGAHSCVLPVIISVTCDITPLAAAHAGSRKPPVIGDHMPPNKLLQGSRDQLGKWMADIPVVGKV